MRIIGVFAALCLVCFDTSATTINEALVSTYKENKQLKAQREAVKAVDEKVMQAISQLLPNVGLSATKVNSTVSVSGSTQQSGMVKTFQVTQNLFKGGADVASVNQARATMESARASLRDVEQRTLLDGVKVFMSVWESFNQYNVSLEQEKDANKFFVGTEDRFKAGEVTKTDVAQAEADLASISAQRLQFKSNYESSKETFYHFTGMEPVGDMIMPSRDIVSVPATEQEAIDIAMANSPLLQRAKYEYKASEYGKGVSKSGIFPKIDLTHEYDDNRDLSQNYQNNNGRTNQTTQIKVSIPLFNGGANWSQIREAKRRSFQSRYALEDATLDVRDKVVAAWQNFKALELSLKSYETQVKFSKIAYEGMLQQEKAGLTATIDVLTARQRYFTSNLNLFNVLNKYYVGLYNLKVAMGQASPKDLGLDVEEYDPAENFNKIKWQLIGAY